MILRIIVIWLSLAILFAVTWGCVSISINGKGKETEIQIGGQSDKERNDVGGSYENGEPEGQPADEGQDEGGNSGG